MANCACNNEKKKQIFSKYLYETSLREENETSMPEILELIHSTNDIVLLTRAFYWLGLYLLSEENGCDKIIKCKVLYDKILIVLNCGLQSKVCIALNLISALLFFGDEQGYSRKQTLHIYALNMVKSSGCLNAMCHLFTNCMLGQWVLFLAPLYRVYHFQQRVCLLSLCRSLCLSCGAAQSQCAHLITQCIRRCRQDNLEAFSLLQILLCNNDTNIRLFHESNGMPIFTRESLQHPECLHLLSTLADNTTPLNKEMLNKSSEIFEILGYFLSKYGSDSSVGKWALIILYSRQKALEKSPAKNVIDNNNTAKDDTVLIKQNINKKLKNIQHSNNETSQLFRNIYKELMTLKNDYNNDKQTDINRFKDIFEIQNNTFRNKLKTNKNITKGIYRDKCTSPYPISKTNDMSFSFLKKQNTDINKKTHNNMLTRHLFEETKPFDLKYKQNKFKHLLNNITKSDLESNITLEFKPPFVSTPKHQKNRSTSWASTIQPLSIKRQNKINRKVHKVYKSKHLIRMPLKEKQNKTMTSKFFDLVNGSCTTLMKSFTNIRNIFKRKISEDAEEETKSCVAMETTNTACSYSFTNYMQKRDAYLRGIGNNTTSTGVLSFITNNCCKTCNDTDVLRHKLENDKSLQNTIKKLKLGINLYGCNFKKISRNMWPRETYMTPAVLYNLYRKLIVK